MFGVKGKTAIHELTTKRRYSVSKTLLLGWIVAAMVQSQAQVAADPSLLAEIDKIQAITRTW